MSDRVTDTTAPIPALENLRLDDDAVMAEPPNLRPPTPTPKSTLSRDGFRDITTEFFAASDRLVVGQLVKDPDFTLLQAVGALEIMDPKMDSGLLEPEYESFEVMAPRIPEEVLGIMDQLLCHEMAYHQGHSLAQTVFACLYVDKLLEMRSADIMKLGQYSGDNIGQGLIENVLLPYCIAVLKCCSATNTQIRLEHCYEEEDFITQTYGHHMFQVHPVSAVIATLDSALGYLTNNQAQIKEEVLDALKHRIHLRQQLLTDMDRKPDEYNSDSGSGWKVSAELTDTLAAGHQLASPVDWAWSMSVQRKLASQVPPRQIVKFEFEKAIETLKGMCSDIVSLVRILDNWSPGNLMAFFYNFMQRKPTPVQYTRSLLLCLFNKNGAVVGRRSSEEFVFEDLTHLVNPIDALMDHRRTSEEVPQSPRHHIAERMEWFGERAGKLYQDLFRTLVQNRSRCRRLLSHSILDWDTLQTEAEDLDNQLKDFTGEEPRYTEDGNELYSYPLSSWVYFHKIRQMEWIHLLGFELDVYLPYECTGMYWYLQHYLRARLSHLNRIRDFLRPTHSARNRQVQERQEERFRDSYAWINYLMIEATAMHDLAGALICLYCVLDRLNLIRPPTLVYGSEALRYELRMKPFLSIGIPDVIPSEHFQEQITMPGLSIQQLLEQAKHAATEAKNHLVYLNKIDVKTARAALCERDHKEYVTGLLRSCLGVGVAVGVLQREVVEEGNKGGEGLIVEIGRTGFHGSFMVPQVKMKEEK